MPNEFWIAMGGLVIPILTWIAKSIGSLAKTAHRETQANGGSSLKDIQLRQLHEQRWSSAALRVLLGEARAIEVDREVPPPDIPLPDALKPSV